ncbi:recombination mediator RecR [Candidatus Magnetomonas plexicatena]|uniref:recombination mediator RecR n=1 Tax=Candidatus Magnetomonas plexicatena TaxID=2552947 RepID=UPI00110315E0|nr:recombination protein RecR [Nitrospirales bacterium LBB_01]
MSHGIIETLVSELMRLPTIGRKTAQRLAFYILSMPEDEAKSIARAILDVKERARLCSVCFNISERETCQLCEDSSRDGGKICVVEEPGNVAVIEKTGLFNGLYHVLHGNLSPIDGITPEKLKLEALSDRVKRGTVSEVILATNPNTKGEMTAQYIANLLRPYKIIVTRIAYGLPMGGDIEFADEVTMGKSFQGRNVI